MALGQLTGSWLPHLAFGVALKLVSGLAFLCCGSIDTGPLSSSCGRAKGVSRKQEMPRFAPTQLVCESGIRAPRRVAVGIGLRRS
jgi:hypothetical protein